VIEKTFLGFANDFQRLYGNEGEKKTEDRIERRDTEKEEGREKEGTRLKKEINKEGKRSGSK
jgi:hypothetical protein